MILTTVICSTTANPPPSSAFGRNFDAITPLWFLFLVLAAVAFQIQTKWFTRFNIFTIFLIGMFMRYGIAVPVSDNVNPSSSTQTPISQAQLTEYYVAIVLTYAGVFVGAFVVYHSRGWRPFGRFLQKWADTRTLIVTAVLINALVLLVWVILPLRDFEAGLLQAGHLTQLAARLHRVTYGNATLYSSSLLNYAGSFARFAIMPAVVWILYFHRGRSRTVHALFWIGFIALAVIGLSAGTKYPELLLLVGFVIARIILAGAPSIFNWKTALVGVVLFFGLVPLLFHFQEPTWSYADLLNGTLFRLTVEYSRVGQLRFIFYPDLHPYLHGTSSFVLRTVAHAAHINTGDAVSPETYIPLHSACVGPDPGTWNAGFFADAWADFGWPGVIVASIIVGVILAAIHRWYENGPKAPLQMGTYTAVCISALWLSDVALLTASWTYGLLSSFLVYWFLIVVPGRWRKTAVKGENKLAPASPPTG